MSATRVLFNAGVTGPSDVIELNSSDFTAQASGSTSAGAGAATIKIQVSNDSANWIDLGTISLTLGTSITTDGLAAFANWNFVRANITAISGTNAAVTVTINWS